jgi:hypothetical protein
MRRALTLAAVALAVTSAGAVLVSCGTDNDARPIATSATGIEAREVTAGDVAIEVVPLQLDASGALFAITLDSHSVDLTADLQQSTLEIANVPWLSVAWTGDGPGGHHREGELRFAPAGEPAGTVRLSLGGFDEPVEIAWELEG